jgi:hypothetical protein
MVSIIQQFTCFGVLSIVQFFQWREMHHDHSETYLWAVGLRRPCFGRPVGLLSASIATIKEIQMAIMLMGFPLFIPLFHGVRRRLSGKSNTHV